MAENKTQPTDASVDVQKLDDIDLDVLRRLIAIAASRGDDPTPVANG